MSTDKPHLHIILMGLVTAFIARGAARGDALPKPTEGGKATCGEALAIVRGLGSELHNQGARDVFVRAAPELEPQFKTKLDIDWRGEALLPSLITMWSRTPPHSVLDCVHCAMFDGTPIVWGVQEQVRRAITIDPNSSEMFIRIGAPVLDRSRTHALLYYVALGASFGGHAVFYHLARSGGVWKIVGRRFLWVS